MNPLGAALHYRGWTWARLRQPDAMEQDPCGAFLSAHIRKTGRDARNWSSSATRWGSMSSTPCASAQNMPIASKAADARAVDCAQPYGDSYDMPNKQETAAIDGMVSDPGKRRRTAPRVASLGLSVDFVVELKRVNTEYRALLRPAHGGLAMPARRRTAKTIRPEMDAVPSSSPPCRPSCHNNGRDPPSRSQSPHPPS